MTNKLLIASAGAGKTHRLAKSACAAASDNKRILILTYTRSNQQEIKDRCVTLGGAKQGKIDVKGWYTFLLEDIVRPYQSIFFKNRIKSINFNQSNPHKKGNTTIAGTAEEFDAKACSVNLKHFLTSNNSIVHTEFLSKLAVRILKVTNSLAVERLCELYSHIFIDEVQDLAGWDYDLLKPIFLSRMPITCVGDFRQTIYDTTSNPKKPSSSIDKLAFYNNLKFDKEELASSRRCIQSICNYADSIHQGFGYLPTVSEVEDVPDEFSDHQGLFAVKKSDINEYIKRFEPVVLRDSVRSANYLQKNDCDKVNFGESKGRTYDRTLIVPTANILAFINGNKDAFSSLKTDKAINRFYVAVTRAKYSVAFLIDDTDVCKTKIAIWKP